MTFEIHKGFKEDVTRLLTQGGLLIKKHFKYSATRKVCRLIIIKEEFAGPDEYEKAVALAAEAYKQAIVNASDVIYALRKDNKALQKERVASNKAYDVLAATSKETSEAYDLVVVELKQTARKNTEMSKALAEAQERYIELKGYRIKFAALEKLMSGWAGKKRAQIETIFNKHTAHV